MALRAARYLALTLGLIALPISAPIAYSQSAVTAEGAADGEAVKRLAGATVYPVSSDPIQNGLIVIRGEKLDYVGRDDGRLADAETIDCSGKHIYPGLIDADTAIGLVEIEAVRATVDMSEVGTLNPNAQTVTAFNPDSELIPVARADGVLVALSVPRGGLISGKSALMYLDGWNESDMAIMPRVGVHVRWPSAAATRTWSRQRPARDQMSDRAERLQQLSDELDRARAYHEARTADANWPYDARLEALAQAALGQIRLFVHADELRQIQEAVAFAASRDLDLVIVGGADAALCVDLLKKHDVPVVVTGTLRLPAFRHSAYDDPYTLPARLHAAGVKFCIAGHDRFSASGVRNLPQHAGTAAAHGLSPADAVRAITLNAAEILGVADRLGSLETGKDATLIVVDNDVLEIASRVEMAFVRGRAVDLDSRHKRLYRKYREKYEPTR